MKMESLTPSINGYDESGYYFSMKRIDRADCPFNIVCGGRGIGKTYSGLYRTYNEWLDSFNAKLELQEKFMYLRRIEAEVKTIVDPKYNPFKALNYNCGWDIQAQYNESQGVGTFFDKNRDNAECAYASAVSVFDKLRGADLIDVQSILYDEYMKQKNQRTLKGEAEAFFNLYETIARNRELQGRKPVKAYLFSNAVSLDSPILAYLGVIKIMEKMQKNGDISYTDRNRGLHIEMPRDLPISTAKKETALYKLLGGTDYYKHAIDNEFAYDSFENVQSCDLRQYYPSIQIDNLYMYAHKTEARFYVTTSKAKCNEVYESDSIPLFRKNYGIRALSMMQAGTIKFSDYEVKTKFHQILMNKYN